MKHKVPFRYQVRQVWKRLVVVYWRRDIRFLFCKYKRIRNIWTGRRNKNVYGSYYLANKQKIKRRLIQRDGKKCQWCGYRKAKNLLTIDHIQEVSKGGKSHMKNLRLLCKPCHELRNSGVVIEEEEPTPLQTYKWKKSNAQIRDEAHSYG